MSQQSLRNKTVTGIGWSAAESFLSHGVTFMVGLVLARLLTPAEYGLIGIVTIFTTILSSVVDSGFSSALIRKKESTDDDYNTMFITNMVMSVVLFVLLFFSAPSIASFFNRAELVALTRAMGFILILQALSIVQNTILTKRIDFKTKAKASVIAAIASGIIGIAFAFLGFGVWSLVAQQLSNKLFFTLSLWFYNRWLPRFSFSVSSFRYMWGFGWKLMTSGLLENIWSQLYHAVVGKFYSPATLGQYTRSKEYAHFCSSNFTSIIQRVSYPVLSEVQDDKVRMVAGYRKIIKLTMFVTAICMISLGAVAEPFIYCLIGAQWHQAATFLPLICVSLSLYPLHAINLNMLKVQGRSDLFLVLEIIKKIIAIGPICLGIFIDIYWMLIGSICTGFISFFLNSYYTGKGLGYTSWMQLKDVAPSYGVACILALSIFPLKFLPLSYWLVLPLQFIVGISVFFLICETTKLPEYVEVKRIAMDFWGKLKYKGNNIR